MDIVYINNYELVFVNEKYRPPVIAFRCSISKCLPYF